MSSRVSLSTFAILAGLIFSPSVSFANSAALDGYKVLASKENGFNISVVEKLLKKGDAAVNRGNFVKAKKQYDEARNVSKQLLSFYRDLSGSFRGLDARIPREMDAKGRNAMKMLAKTNLRLAALFRKQNQPEVAVPVLIEVVRIMTPAKSEGKKAYETLVELGFVETPYSAAR